MELLRKKIFITGSSGGIGSAICEKFLNHDCKLILTSSSKENSSSENEISFGLGMIEKSSLNISIKKRL